GLLRGRHPVGAVRGDRRAVCRPAARLRERFTLVGCTPGGALADLLDRLPAEALGTEQAWLGGGSLMAPAPPPGLPPSWWGEDLGDVVVLAQRPSITVPETVDIDRKLHC